MTKNIISFAVILLVLFSGLELQASSDSLRSSTCGKRWSIDAMGGYGFSVSRNVLGSTITNDGQNNITTKQIIGTYGQGIITKVALNYRLKKHVFVSAGVFGNWGAEIQTFLGSSLSTPDTYQEVSEQVSSIGSLIGIGIADTFSRYHVGLHNYFACGFNNTGYWRRTDAYPSDIYFTEWKYTEGISFGWMGNLNVAYAINEHFIMGLEGFFFLHSWSPLKGNLIEYKHNGQDLLSTVPDENKTVTFSDNLAGNSFTGYPPGQALRFTYPLHVAGCGLLISYRF